jgi:hypothetical protein
MQYRPQPNLISAFTTTKNKYFTGNDTSTSIGGIKSDQPAVFAAWQLL